MQIKKYIKCLVLLLVVGCSSNKSIDQNNSIIEGDFVKFVNENKSTIKRDGEIIKDKNFNLQIPNSLSEKKIKISSYFLHDLKFDKKQKIVLLYTPDKKFHSEKKALDLSCEDFEKELNKLEIQYELESVKFNKNRRFGIILLDVNFFVMYINVKSKNVKDYNYAINSVKTTP